MTTTVETSPALAFEVEVVAVVRLSPSYLRITFGGPCLADFHGGGRLGTRDLRIKLIVPAPGRRSPAFPDMDDGWYQRWLAMDPAVRGAMRTYTVREARVDGPDPQVDIDFVIHLDEHGRGGPASSWASSAKVGDQITIIGPNARSEKYGGIEWQPPVTDGRRAQVLLAGDETTVPAIASVLESLPEHYQGRTVLEVPVAEDFQMIRTPADVEITWLARDSRRHGQLLRDAVRTSLAASPPNGADDAAFFAWIAGEASTVRDLRRYLVREQGVDRRRVTFMGYWRLGKAEGP